MRNARDWPVLGAAAAHGAVLLVLALAGVAGVLPTIVVAVLLAWGANTIAHIHLHTPLFRARAGNRALSLYLSVILGFPQSVWRHRHLRHHAGAHASRVPRPATRALVIEALAFTATLALAFAFAPAFVLGAWLPGIAGGLVLCALQGRMEHARGEDAGVSCYGRVHNTLWFNDGFHVEHHRWPGLHWSALPARKLSGPTSRFGPWLRPLVDVPATLLDRLERLVLHSRWLQRRVVAAHVRATAKLLPELRSTQPLGSALIVGGGLFPRTVHVLRELAPDARLDVLDLAPASLALARAHLADPNITWRLGAWQPGDDVMADVVVVPLAYRGDRRALLARERTTKIVHLWLWNRAPHPSAVVAWWLLKRVVLVPRA